MREPLTESAADPRWGQRDRDIKAHAIAQTLRHYMSLPLDQADCVDIGCGSGGIAFHLAPSVRTMVGVDPESWQRWKDFQDQRKNLQFLQESVEHLSIQDSSVDVVICNQVYEHVPDPQKLIQEIQRILKPGGYCYFAGPNLWFPIEPHIFWPCVHWLPRGLAIRIILLVRSRAVLDANSASYWTLRRWLSDFEIRNAVPHIIKHPEEYGRNSLVFRAVSRIPERLIDFFTFLSPGFVFVLFKPGE